MQRGNQQITFINVLDLERSHRFYHTLLGLALVLDHGDCRIYRVTGDAYVGICKRPQNIHAPGSFLFTLITPQVEEEVERLDAAGVTIEVPTQHNSTYQITQAFILDPDGYRIEIQRFHDPNWDQVTATKSVKG